MLRTTVTTDRRNKEKPWVMRWFGKYDPFTDKQKRFSRSFKYKSDAVEFAAEMKRTFKNNRNKELPDDSEKLHTLGALCRKWLQLRTKDKKVTTIELYASTFDRLKKYFGANRLLTEITALQAEEFIVEQRNRSKHKSGGKELSVSSRNQIIRNAHMLFKAAIKWGYVENNPFDEIPMPKPEQKNFHEFTPDQERALLRVAPTLREKALYAVLLTTGARLNTVVSRTWADIDFEHREMIICNREGSDALPPFTMKIRSKKLQKVPLSNYVLELLAELHGEASEAVPYIFLTRDRYERILRKWHKCRAEGTPWKTRWLANNIRRAFLTHCRHAGIKPIGTLTIHTLRKNMSQTLQNAGLPVKAAQEMLGHSDSRTTLENYSQMNPDHQQQIRQVVEERLNEKPTEEVRMPGRIEPISTN